MKRTPKKDGLERLFNKYLSKDEPAANGWNVPSDDIFLNAINELDPPSRKKPIFLIVLLLLSGTLLGLLLWNTKQVHQMQLEVEQLKSITQSQSSIATEPSQKTQLRELPILKSEKIPTSPDKPGSSFNLKKASNSKPLRLKAPMASSSGNNLISNTPKLREITKAQATAANEPLQKEELAVIEPIAPLEEKQVFAPFQSIKAPPALQMEKVEATNLSSTQKKAVYFFIGTKLTSFRMEGSPEEVPLLLDYDQKRLAIHLGIAYKQQLSRRIYMDYGLSYAQFSVASSYSDDMVYQSKNREQGGSGNLAYRSAQPIFTPLGETVRTAPLSFNDAVPVDNEELLTSFTQIKQDFKTIGLQSRLGYKILDRSNWSLAFQAGFELDFIMGFHEWSSTDVKKGSDLVMFEELNLDSNINLKRWLAGLNVGMQLQRKWGDHFYTGLEIGSYQPLNSVRHTSGASKTYLNVMRLNLQAGINF